MSTAPRLELKGITKRFPNGVLANDGIDLAVRPGQIHAILGENGAGKSTLVKIIDGVLAPDAGDVLWDGRALARLDPTIARRLGIGMVFQHFSLFDALTVGENVALGLDREARRDLGSRLREVSTAFGLPLDPSRAVSTLSVGERQRIEVVRCLLQEPKLLIMDEPTSVLTPQEVEGLFATLRRVASGGCSILYISHKLEEVRTLCEWATILRAGRVVASCDPRAETARSLAERMIGADLRSGGRRARRRPGGTRLAVVDLSLPPAGPHGTALERVGLEVRAGEIVGVAGVAGNGQAELLAALSGERLAPTAEAIRVDGRAVGRLGPAGRRSLGLCCLPEERTGHAAVPDLTLAENGLLTGRARRGLAPGGLIRGARIRAFAGQIIERFGVRATGPGAPARSLSGGNLQKFVVGREILQEPAVLVVAQPTWGVDAGAAGAIHEALLERAAAGAAILLVSQDLDELLALCDRLAVIHAGLLSAMMDPEETRIDEIGLLMGGARLGREPARAA